MHVKDCCEGFGPTGLEIGDKVQVIEGQARNAIRCAPQKNAELRARIRPGRKMKVLYGPVCVEKIIWWYVRTKGAETETGKEIDGRVEGWTAEWFEDEGYYLE